MEFGTEFLRDVREEIIPLTEAHYQEVAHYKDIPLDVDWDRLADAESQGHLRIYTVRTTESKLIGYAIFVVQPNMHYRQSLQAMQDVLFISEQHRGFGRKFIEWCDDRLRDDGVQAVYHHVKVSHNFAPMLERMGYELIDRVYGRRLDA